MRKCIKKKGGILFFLVLFILLAKGNDAMQCLSQNCTINISIDVSTFNLTSISNIYPLNNTHYGKSVYFEANITNGTFGLDSVLLELNGINYSMNQHNLTLDVFQNNNYWLVWANDTKTFWNHSERWYFTSNSEPIVSLTYPLNGQTMALTEVDFQFSVSDYNNNTLSCILFINDTGSFISKGLTNVTSNNYLFANITTNLSNGNYEWFINCSDEYNMTESSHRNVTINTNYTIPITSGGLGNSLYIPEKNISEEIFDITTDSGMKNFGTFIVKIPDKQERYVTIENTGTKNATYTIKKGGDKPSWIDYEPKTFKLAPGQSKVITVKINVPETASYGQNFFNFLEVENNHGNTKSVKLLIQTSPMGYLYKTVQSTNLGSPEEPFKILNLAILTMLPLMSIGLVYAGTGWWMKKGLLKGLRIGTQCVIFIAVFITLLMYL